MNKDTLVTVAILVSSVRDNRDGNKAAEFIRLMVVERKWKAVMIDPVDFDLPLLHKMYKEMKNPEEKFVRIHKLLESADGFILVTAEYNHGIPPALKNLLDHFRDEYFFKPSAIVSYSSGPFGGVRAAEQLRLVCAELKMPSIPATLPISRVHEAFNDDGSSVDGIYERRSKKFLDEFEWYLQAFKEQRGKGTPY